MSKKRKEEKTRHKGSPANATPVAPRRTRAGLHKRRPLSRAGGWFDLRRPETTSDALLHPQKVDGRPWKHLPLILVLAFAVRASVALSGDFVLHPDEIMQYLEPAHRLVFGNGVIYWEFFYGARSWLVPGLVAGVLKLFDLAGFGQPFWYVGGVKLTFCLISLAVPAGMYFFARRHFSEAAARAALLAGTFWYELIVFAHKPMTEFLATGLLMGLLVLCLSPAADRVRTVWLVALLTVLTAAVRLQYAPLALVLLGLFFLRTEKKWQMTLAATALFLAVGVFDMLTWNLAAGSFGKATWDYGLFHSYLTNILVNLTRAERLSIIHPAWQYLVWLLCAGAGLTLLCVAMALRELRRYGLLLALIGLPLLLHAAQTHKEYRFVFVIVPLWLLIGTDLVVRFTTAASRQRLWTGAAAVVFAAVSSAGLLEALPYQNRSYQGVYIRPPERLGFIGGQDPAFAAYRYLARAPGVAAVVQPEREYALTPGYYYLHRKIPFYARDTLDMVKKDLPALTTSVSHVISESSNLFLPGYSVEKVFGPIRIWRREENGVPVRQWRSYAPIINSDYAQLLRRLDPDAPAVPPDSGIQFADGTPPESDS